MHLREAYFLTYNYIDILWYSKQKKLHGINMISHSKKKNQKILKMGKYSTMKINFF